jgi:hypothetical protein
MHPHRRVAWYAWEALGTLLLAAFVVGPVVLVLAVGDPDFTLLYLLLNGINQ